MSQRQTLMILGVWLAVLPFLGFPPDWEKVLACVSGLLLVVLAYRLGSPERAAPADPAGQSYAEHKSTANADSVSVGQTKPDVTPITGSSNAPVK